MKSPSKWRTVTGKVPCPICQKPDWCGMAEDGTVVICMRVQSQKPTRNGGWLHRLDTQTPTRTLRLPPPPRTRPANINAEALVNAWERATENKDRQRLSGLLGIGIPTLVHLRASWADSYAAWAFPMRNHTGKTVGIRLRAEDGRKWAVTGSRAGLFYSDDWVYCKRVLICEGPTDTAAAMEIGFGAIGRPSCRGQEDMLRELLAGYRGDVVIMQDRDSAKHRPDGSKFFPGQEGAALLASRLKRPLRIITPPGNDLRGWVCRGGTATQLGALIDNARWQNVR